MRSPFTKGARSLSPALETGAFPEGIDVYHWLCRGSRPPSKRTQRLPPRSAAPNGFPGLSKRFLPTSMPTTAIAQALRAPDKKPKPMTQITGKGPRRLDRRQVMQLTAAGAATAILTSDTLAQSFIQTPVKAIGFDAFVTFDPRPIFALTEQLFPGKGGANQQSLAHPPVRIRLAPHAVPAIRRFLEGNGGRARLRRRIGQSGINRGKTRPADGGISHN